MKYRIAKGETSIIGRHKVFRIYAAADFLTVDGREVKAGTRGGWVESENNLAQDGSCWIAGEAAVYDGASVYDDAQMEDYARVRNKAQVYGEAKVFGQARVYGEAKVFGQAQVYDKAEVFGQAQVYGQAQISDKARVYGQAQVFGEARVSDEAVVSGKARVCDKARVFGQAQISDEAVVSGEAKIYESAGVRKQARVFGRAQVYGKAQVYGRAQVYGKAQVYGQAQAYGHAQVYGQAQVYDEARAHDYAQVFGQAKVCGRANVFGYDNVFGDETRDCGGGGQNVRAYAECFVCEKATDILIVGSLALVRQEDGMNVSADDSDEDCNAVCGTTESLPAYIDKGVRYFTSDDICDDTYFRVSFPLGEIAQADITDYIEHGLAIVDADSVKRGNSGALEQGVLVKGFCGSMRMQRRKDGTELVHGRGSNIFDIDIINGNDQNED